MWHMWKSISGLEEDDFTTVQCVQLYSCTVCTTVQLYSVYSVYSLYSMYSDNSQSSSSKPEIDFHMCTLSPSWIGD